jgi:hypothetical protein
VLLQNRDKGKNSVLDFNLMPVFSDVCDLSPFFPLTSSILEKDISEPVCD